MKIMMRLHILYYLCLLVFILTIPKLSTDANILKIVLFLLTIGVFIFLCSYYIVLSFNKKIGAVKKYSNINVGIMCGGIILTLTFGHYIYTKWNSLVVLLTIFIILFIVSNFLNYKIKKIVEDQQFDLMKEVKLFYKMGQALDKTPINNAISKLDYLFYGFCIAVFIAEDIYIFAGAVGVILILSIKYVRAIKSEFLKSGLITVKETNLSIAAYFFFYLFSIVWMMFIPNLSTLLVGAASLLAIKIYIRRIAEKVYEEKNGISK
ncbi:hypothetical protein [Bacillus sp. OK048]|uniref:hypothetical protein n=1 Tax=Bacillus sp. OK048 TaxID=1882761 RepID=UPI001113A104|nr:hypothetical protein [Bacillus sp. OK048]